MDRKYIFYRLLLALSALLLAVPAAYFSVFGLSKLYIGAGIAGIILFGAIEFGKIVSVSYLYAFWSTISLMRKIYLTSAVIVAMSLTSIGIYGFLSAAFQTTSTSIENINSQIKVIENKQGMFYKRIENLKEQIQLRTDRVNKLSNLRTQQEARLDTLYHRGNFASAKATELNIKETNATIDKLNSEIIDLSTQINSLNDSISAYDIKIMELNNNQYQHDLGPLKYVSELLEVPMNKIVNWLTLSIIFIFDPFAIALLIAFNHLTLLSKRKNDENEVSKNTEIKESNFKNFINKINKNIKIYVNKDINKQKDVEEIETNNEKIHLENVEQNDKKEDTLVDYWQEPYIKPAEKDEDNFGHFDNYDSGEINQNTNQNIEKELTEIVEEKQKIENELQTIYNEKIEKEKELENIINYKDKIENELKTILLEKKEIENELQNIIKNKLEIENELSLSNNENIKLKEELKEVNKHKEQLEKTLESLKIENQNLEKKLEYINEEKIKLEQENKEIKNSVNQIKEKIREDLTEEFKEKMNEQIENLKEEFAEKYENKKKKRIIFRNNNS